MKNKKSRPAVEMRPGKLTGRWCRGQVGRKHSPKCVSYAELKHSELPKVKDWRVLVCSLCHKELAWWMPAPGRLRPKPDWVED
jgi:hypothetical protein